MTQQAGYRAHGPYRIANVRTDGYTVYSNTVPAEAFRGVGTPQGVWAYESQMDMIAHEMGWDRVEFHLKNLLDKGEPFVAGDAPVDCDLKEGLRRLAVEVGWGDRELEPDCGMVIACALKDGGGNYKISAARLCGKDGDRLTLGDGCVRAGELAGDFRYSEMPKGALTCQ